MAVVIEEEKRDRLGLVNIVSWVVILLVVVISVYYIFFRNPEIVDVRVPPTFERTQRISNIELDPAQIVDSPSFRGRVEQVEPPCGGAKCIEAFPERYGRENPFVPLE
jgi:hypothetical protein